MERATFSKREHLKKNSSIKDVFDKGTPFKARLIKVYIVKRDTDERLNRVAFIIRRGLYNKRPVLRNRFRRVLREAYRQTKYLLPPGYDIVILANNIKEDTRSISIEEELRDVFKKCSKK